MNMVKEDMNLDARRKKFETDLAEEQQRAARSDVSAKYFKHIDKTPLDKAIEAKENAKGGLGQAIRISSEFLSAIFVGIALGYTCDRFLGTSPWGIIVFLFLGFCAGVLNLLRYTDFMQKNK